MVGEAAAPAGGVATDNQRAAGNRKATDSTDTAKASAGATDTPTPPTTVPPVRADGGRDLDDDMAMP